MKAKEYVAKYLEMVDGMEGGHKDKNLDDAFARVIVKGLLSEIGELEEKRGASKNPAVFYSILNELRGKYKAIIKQLRGKGIDRYNDDFNLVLKVLGEGTEKMLFYESAYNRMIRN